MTDSLTTPKQKDGFAHESPVRAFTDFQVAGDYAIGKGFRPSLQHLSSYLDAMLNREGWRLLQIILPANDASDPTLIFEREYDPKTELVMPTGSDAIKLPGDDPVNPRHYHGTACAEIGEHLTGNSYQVLKYNWRLGEKDDPCIELGKSLWYLDREIALAGTGWAPVNGLLPSVRWFNERLAEGSEWAQTVARPLLEWNRFGKSSVLIDLQHTLTARKAQIECGPGAAV